MNICIVQTFSEYVIIHVLYNILVLAADLKVMYYTKIQVVERSSVTKVT